MFSNYTRSSKSEAECNSCQSLIKTSIAEYFVYIPIKEQLKDSIDFNIEQILQHYSAVSAEKEIADMQNADIFKATQKIPKRYSIAFNIKCEWRNKFTRFTRRHQIHFGCCNCTKVIFPQKNGF